MKVGLHYSFQSPTHRWAELYRESLEQIMLADGLGFSTVTVAEHHFFSDGWMPSPLVICAGIASATKRIRLGTNIIILPLYHPVKVAEDAAVVDVLSGGRFILGIGLGVDPREFNAFATSKKERVPRFEESAHLIRRLLTQENVSHNGKYWHVENITVTPKPVQVPNPPIWVAATQESAIRRAALLGDAWSAAQIDTIEVLKSKYETYKDAVRKTGRDFQSLERPLRREAYISDNAGTAWEEVRDSIKIEYGEIYFKLGDLRDDHGNYLKPGQVEYDEDVEESLRKRFLIGTPDDMIENIEKIRRELDVTELLLRVQFPNMRHDKVCKCINLIGKKVIPYFSEKDPLSNE